MTCCAAAFATIDFFQQQLRYAASISRCSIRTVAAAADQMTSGMSLCPTTEISSGQRRQASAFASGRGGWQMEGELDHARMQAVLNGDCRQMTRCPKLR